MAQENPIYTAAVIGAGKAGQDSGTRTGGFRIGYTHAETFKRNPRTQLIACADINPDNLRAFMSRFGVPHGFTEYEAMLHEVKPDLVSIGTYVGLHRPMIEKAAEAGVKGILCEKPFVASPADLKAVQRIAQATGVKIVVAHIRRYLPAFARARQLYNDGAIGQPVMCVAGIEGWDLSEWGSHWLDMFRFFHNDQPVKWVFGQLRVRDTRGFGHAMEDHGVAYFEFENGGKGLVDGGRGLNGGMTMALLGTQGSIRVLGEDTLVIQNAAGQCEERFPAEQFGGWTYAWDCLLNDLIQWVEGGGAPMTGLPNVSRSAELNLAAYISAVRGDRVDLPLEDDTDEWPVEILARRRAQALNVRSSLSAF